LLKSWIPRENNMLTDYNRSELELQSFLADKPKSETRLPEEAAQWLARLVLLYSVPLHYIVPDERMLPSESLRFFYLDFNWVCALLDGALSVGRHCHDDAEIDRNIIEQACAEAINGAANIRFNLLKQVRSSEAATAGVCTGMLFNSGLVSLWKGMEIYAYDKQQLLDILRMEKLTDSILICLFNGIPSQVELVQPPEGLIYGAHKSVNGSDYIVKCKDFTTGKPTGKEVPLAVAKNRRVNVKKLAGDIEAAFNGKKVTSAEMALQLLTPAQRIVCDLAL
jgi:hypothetical protein